MICRVDVLLYGEGGTVVRAWLPGASGSRAKYTVAARRRAQAVSSTTTEEAPMLSVALGGGGCMRRRPTTARFGHVWVAKISKKMAFSALKPQIKDVHAPPV